jgi:hypothetical protein
LARPEAEPSLSLDEVQGSRLGLLGRSDEHGNPPPNAAVQLALGA